MFALFKTEEKLVEVGETGKVEFKLFLLKNSRYNEAVPSVFFGLSKDSTLGNVMQMTVLKSVSNRQSVKVILIVSLRESTYFYC